MKLGFQLLITYAHKKLRSYEISVVKCFSCSDKGNKNQSLDSVFLRLNELKWDGRIFELVNPELLHVLELSVR